MRIDRVTITGADDSIRHSDLVRLSALYPFVEWGILLSERRLGFPRFPSYDWLRKLYDQRTPTMQLAGHVCGRWVRDMLGGGALFPPDDAMHTYFSMFQRLQWNFHAERLRPQLGCVATGLRMYDQAHIFQMDGVNDQLLFDLNADGVKVFPLFDRSGGDGVVPKTWPAAMPGLYCGYAGGLGPDTLAAELVRIEAAAGDATIWIDMESRVRSEDDRQFDLVKVEYCLSLVAPMIGVTDGR